MNFKNVLRQGVYALNLKGETKQAIIEEMVDMLVAAGKIKDRDAAVQAVLERERKMSTGMQSGIAIPHGKTPAVDDLVVATAIKKEGVDFGSLDGKPSNIFIMAISSTTRTGPHIQYLSEISKLLTREDIRTRMLNAGTTEELASILVNS